MGKRTGERKTVYPKHKIVADWHPSRTSIPYLEPNNRSMLKSIFFGKTLYTPNKLCLVCTATASRMLRVHKEKTRGSIYRQEKWR
ncbi:MAG: hypothetical protein AOA66_1140 [Candidatus Bathyarchaeota archaeon BA2]|nr:MAG: hypothetical protein AOA66_1140 [Candidatus Bathyarchaeota archaeon BA2]